MAVILCVNNAVFEFQDARADVILKYSADEARNLKSYGEFPENVKIIPGPLASSVSTLSIICLSKNIIF